jgi:hypothetical protein
MAATAFVEHELPGRVRLKIPSHRGDVTFFESLVRTLSDLVGIDELIANPFTGSIIIRHSGPAEPIVSRAAELDLFEIGERDEASRRRFLPLSWADRDPRTPEILSAASLLLAGLGTYQLSQGEVLGSASENFWSAYSSSRLLESLGLATLFAGLGIYQLLNGRLLGSAASLFFYALLALRIAELGGPEASQKQSA